MEATSGKQTFTINFNGEKNNWAVCYRANESKLPVKLTDDMRRSQRAFTSAHSLSGITPPPRVGLVTNNKVGTIMRHETYDRIETICPLQSYEAVDSFSFQMPFIKLTSAQDNKWDTLFR